LVIGVNAPLWRWAPRFALRGSELAVAIGMVLAAHVSAALGMASMADAERLRDLLLRFGLPVTPPAELAPDALLARMRLDKKANAAGLRLVLWDGIGAARLVADVADAVVLDALR